jgi:hypothetical protein
MSRYCGTVLLREYLSANLQLDEDQNGLLLRCLNRAEAAIDAYTRRSFATAQGTVLYSRHTAKQVGAALYLDEDLYALGSITNGDSQNIPAGSVWLEPRNVGPPYRIIRLKSSYVWTFNTDSEITITGGWGYSGTAPDDIVQATVRYAAYLYRQKDATGPDNQAGFPEAGQISIPQGMPSDVRWLIDPYRSRTGGVT